MRKKIFIAAAVVVLAFVVVVAVQPSDYRVVRTTTISAPALVVFVQVNDFHRWGEWSPWAHLDPNMKQTFEGTPTGTGAIYTWSGSGKVGEGKMTILESRPSELVRIQLEFIKPFASTCATDFTFHSEKDQTSVTWSMAGKNNFIGKAFCLFMNMDKTVGGDFERGLSMMKSTAEAAAKPSTSMTSTERPNDGKASGKD